MATDCRKDILSARSDGKVRRVFDQSSKRVVPAFEERTILDKKKGLK
jgi:hypothetical protein